MTAPSASAWRCSVCGYIHRDADPPDWCPVCGAGRADFEPYAHRASAAVHLRRVLKMQPGNSDAWALLSEIGNSTE